jgi:hypothetical protein
MSASRDELIARLEAVERRLAEHVEADDHGLPPGLSEPDPGEAERWEAGQVWAHVAEFPSYWLGQIRAILDAPGGGQTEAVPFGRTRTDPGRLGAIERHRHTDPAALLERVRTSLAEVVDTIRGLPAEAWTARGRHASAGELNVGAIVERFVVNHLEEHADTLDALRRGSG